MLRSFKIGKLFGIPLYLHTTFFLLPVWVLLASPGIGSLSAIFWMLVLVGLFACVVLHELGHALMARFFGIGTESITLYPIGGVARLERMSEKPARRSALLWRDRPSISCSPSCWPRWRYSPPSSREILPGIRRSISSP